jgi:YHS domain-containing protein
MTNIFIRSAIAGALLLGLPTAAVAATTGEFDDMCTQGLVLGKDVPTDCSVNTEIDGKTYCFGNEAAKTEFMKDPKANLARAQEYYNSKHPM